MIRAATRIVLVDNHDLFRTGLVAGLGKQPDIDVVGQASSGQLGVRLALELVPDVVLTDLRMPDLDGVKVIRAIVSERPDAKIIVLSAAAEPTDIASALLAGARSFLVKDSSVGEITSAVRAAAGGSSWLSPTAAEWVLQGIKAACVEPEPSSPVEQLTSREREVVRLLARGHNNSEIAKALQISPSTAKNHVSRILAKLGLQNRSQAAAYAVRMELD